jgi:Bacterial SH3 domain/N-acetylmuramoyl-L-alanine amidase
MTWRGCDPAIEIKSVDELHSYIRSLTYTSWRPSNFVIHNTASPTLYQYWHSVPPAQRMENLRHYYENEMGWSAGPHCFIDGKSWWIFTPFNVKGVHSPSWNGTMLGFECVGDYAKESDETSNMPAYPGGADVMKMAHALSSEVCSFFGWDPERLKFHKEDPATDHDCPGKNMVKSEFIDDVCQYMGDGGDAEQPPFEPVQGVVRGLVAGDTLNIRSSSSSSANIIGTAENEDIFEIVGEVWNGSTRWLRIQFGDAEGSGVAVYGWASAQYIELEGQPPETQIWHENITATVFGNDGDEQDSAYPDIDMITGTTKGVALPFKWKGTRPKVEVSGPRGKTTTDIVDLGPWNTNDPNYVCGSARPLVENQYIEGTVAQNGQVPTNDAAIDLTKPIADIVGISGKGKVRWRLVT